VLVASTHSPRSQQSPPRINAISIEMLSAIFRLASDEARLHLGTVDLHRQNLSTARLSAVCRLWRAVTIGDAVLWCNIAFSTSRLSTIKCATEFLRRSRRAKLKVQIIDIQKDITPNIARVSTLMDEIARQSDRITKFEAVGLSPLVAEALVFPAENLTHLTINGCGPEDIPLIFGGKLPRLKRLALSNPSGWSLRAFPTVTKVFVHGNGRRISTKSLANFLDGASNLEQLSLSRIRDPRAGRQHATRPPTVLPSLRELKVAFCDSIVILGLLDLPHSTRTSILSGENNDRHMLQCLPTTAAAFQPVLYGTQSLVVNLTAAANGSHLITHRGGRPSFFLQVYDERRQLDLGWVSLTVDAITESKPFHLIESLILSVEQCSVPWKKWLPQLVRIITMDICSVDVEELVYELSRTHPDQDGPLCPSLRYLSLERKGCGPALDSSILKLCLLARSQARNPITCLRIRARDWTAFDRMDLGWKALVTSQGRPLYVTDVPDAEYCAPDSRNSGWLYDHLDEQLMRCDIDST